MLQYVVSDQGLLHSQSLSLLDADERDVNYRCHCLIRISTFCYSSNIFMIILEISTVSRIGLSNFRTNMERGRLAPV